MRAWMIGCAGAVWCAGLLFATPALAETKHRYFIGESVSLQYDARRYKAITETVVEPEGMLVRGNAAIYRLDLLRNRTIGDSEADLGTICMGTLAACATVYRAQTQYWLDDQNELRIFSPTEPVGVVTIGGRQVYEAFPLCGWAGISGTVPYGGQCYVAVIPLESKVISLTFLLGEADGCRRYDRCWAKALESARGIAATVR